MTFPNPHRFPGGVPLWTLANHTLQAGERVEATQYEQGEDRQREIRTFTPYMASVATKWLTQAEFDLFDTWFETEVEAGARRFDCPIASIAGEGVQWWEAQFVGPYRMEARRARYQVTAELILLDGPYAGGNGPGTVGDTRVAPSVSARGYVETQGRVTVAAGTVRAWGITDTEGRVVVNRTVRARGLVETDGQVIVDVSYLLLEDGSSFLLFEDSGRIILEP